MQIYRNHATHLRVIVVGVVVVVVGFGVGVVGLPVAPGFMSILIEKALLFLLTFVHSVL